MKIIVGLGNPEARKYNLFPADVCFGGICLAFLFFEAIERLAASPITELAMLDTINIPQEKMLPTFKMITTAPIFAAAIENVYLDRPMSKIYD